MFVHSRLVCTFSLLFFHPFIRQSRLLVTMKKLLPLILVIFSLTGYKSDAQSTARKYPDQAITARILLAKTILADQNLTIVKVDALKLLNSFSAGNSYKEIWIRDFNTFINGSLKVHTAAEVKSKLLLFLKTQSADGNIVDGLVESANANAGYNYGHFVSLPGWATHKNTVESDQESSLVQAVSKYVVSTGDSTFLIQKVGGISVIGRLEKALLYIIHARFSPRYGLVTGATTIDWGDVQPEKGWGVRINEHTKWSIDIYDNAMYMMAVQNFITLKPTTFKTSLNWDSLSVQLKTHVRSYLWDTASNKYLPHLYLEDSPFRSSFDEKRILFAGGSIMAVLAGFNTQEEVKAINSQLIAAALKEPKATIGMTVYPPYPADEFANMHPYLYQNAGDWTWFGGRIVPALIPYGMVQEAYHELLPMIARTLKYKGFYEWYDVKTGEPKGSASFRGEAGVLFEAIMQLQKWAIKNQYPE